MIPYRIVSRKRATADRNCGVPFTSPLSSADRTYKRMSRRHSRLQPHSNHSETSIISRSVIALHHAAAVVSTSFTAATIIAAMRFFINICKPVNCLHHLLPPPPDLAVTSRLRKPTAYPRPSLRTKRYCSAVSYALLSFQ